MITTAGRIVVYCQPDAEIPINGINTHPAIITAVHDNDCVNLTVFFDTKPPECRSSILHVEALSTDGLGGGYWKWPDRVPEDATVEEDEAAEDESPPMTEDEVAGMPTDQGSTADETNAGREPDDAGDRNPNVNTGSGDQQPAPVPQPAAAAEPVPAPPPPNQPVQGQAAAAPVGDGNPAAADGSAKDTTNTA